MQQLLLQSHHLAEINALMLDLPMRFGLPLQQVLTRALDEMQSALAQDQTGGDAGRGSANSQGGGAADVKGGAE